MAADDGSEDINDFLLRIRELGDQRDREDEERTRKLEEEILQGRKERQARRAAAVKTSNIIEHISWLHGNPFKSRDTVVATTSKLEGLDWIQSAAIITICSRKQRIKIATCECGTVFYK
ncbi:MAG: hypothetical protein Q9183_004349 [Haloplaca sp. 2 TL-2023]